MRLFAAFFLLLAASLVRAERILLIPLDSRPAAGQFAQMIAKTASIDVELPPLELLGKFTIPGKSDAILDWLERQDLSDVSAVVASTDMVCYGGLIASRTNRTTVDLALQRARRLSRIVRTAPHTRLYVFASTMRLFPTATRESSRYRMVLAKYEEAKAKARVMGDQEAKRTADRLRPTLPSQEIEAYETTRRRNIAVQEELLRMTAAKSMDYLVMGQDDARPFGPHVAENAALKRLSNSLGLQDSVFFCEGIDQHANILVSRALLAEAGWTPVVRIVVSDEDGLKKYASFESKPIRESLRDQLLASGARPAKPNDEYDYTLYLNTPERREDRFATFLATLKDDVDQGFPVAVADINLAKDGTADPALFNGLSERQRMMSLLAFAGWNTAGNTMGTAIPAANVYLLSRKLRVDPLVREVAQREFLLHRFVNDVAYHKLTRPAAYSMIRNSGVGSIEETYGEPFAAVEAFVQRDLRTHLMQTFQDQFMGRRFFAGTKQYAFSGIEDISITLPWPRAYEVRLSFHLQATPVP
ncbi:DUF4127 family protein [bacterium]|nr:MAG: DUF4127 family protein [bacterium]